jgi:DNA-binding NarL/FixJ family response regulator
VRIVLGEDSVLLREGLARLLREAGHCVVAAVGDADALLAAIADTTPDVAVVDVRMPPTFTDDGLRAALQARRQQPGLGVLVLSQYVEETYARDLLADGGRGVGYLLKDRVQDLDALADALDRVASGGSVLDPEVVAQLLVRRHATQTLDSLTPRERAVLSLMAEGRSNPAIADALVVSEGAVEKHVSSILRKLDLAPSEADHRRVLAVLAWLRGASRG